MSSRIRQVGYLGGSFVAASLGASAVSTPAWAADQDDSVETIAEVLVTARRREESELEVPISMTVLNAERIDDSGFHQLSDINNFVPNVRLGGEAALQIRGIESGTRNAGFESSSVVYVDGVYQGRPQGGNQQDLLDIASLEVLRGPQGTLFGKNTPAGAVNITTQKPGQDWGVRTEAEIGDRDLRRIAAMVSGPIIDDSLGFKLVGFTTEQDGAYTNTFTGSDIQGIDTAGARGTLRATFGGTELLLSADTFRTRSTNWQGSVVTGDGAPPPDGDRRKEEYDFDGHVDTDRDSVSLTVNQQLGSFLLTSITAGNQQKYTFANDSDLLPIDLFTTDFVDDADVFTQELRLTSPGDQPLQYVAGLYYYRQRIDSNHAFIVGPALDAQLSALLGFPYEASDVVDDSRVTSESASAFIHATYDFTSSFTGELGVRYTDETKDFRFQQTSDELLAMFGILPPNIGPMTDSLAETNWSPTASFAYKPSEDFNLYVKASRGFKSGGFNPDVVFTTPQPFGGESVTSYEVGAKGVLWNRTTSFSLAIFDESYEDLQVSQFLGPLQGFQVVNAGSATIRGFELDMTSKPTDGLTVRAAIGYLDAVYDEFANGAGEDFSGNRIQNVSPWNLSGSTKYALKNGLFARAEANYRSQTYFTPANTEEFGRGDATLVNVQVGYEPWGQPWSVILYATNVFDSEVVEDVVAGLVPGLTQRIENVNEPRTIGLRVRYKR